MKTILIAFAMLCAGCTHLTPEQELRITQQKAVEKTEKARIAKEKKEHKEWLKTLPWQTREELSYANWVRPPNPDGSLSWNRMMGSPKLATKIGTLQTMQY